MTRGAPSGARRMVWPIALPALVSAVAVMWSALAAPPAQVVYNASDSVPVGWYRIEPVEPNEPVQVGDLVLVRLPPETALFAARRGYLPTGVPLLKSVAAGPRQRVCATGTRVRVDGQVVAHALKRDRAGRPMPCWQGCRELGEREVLLLSANHAESFDGRYFGPVTLDAVLGKAHPLSMD